MKLWLKGVLVFLAAVAVLSAIGASMSPPVQNNVTPLSVTVATSQTYQSYSDSVNGFTVQVPGAWEIFRNPTPTSEESAAGLIPVLSVHPSNSQGFGGSFVVSVDKSPQIGSASQYAVTYKEKLAQIWSSEGITYNSLQNMTLAGSLAFEIAYTIHFPTNGGGDCPARDVVTTHNGMAYILGFDTCSASDASANLTRFGTFESSFGFLSP